MRVWHARLDTRDARLLGIIASDNSRPVFGHLWRDLAQNLCNDILYRPTRVDNDGILVEVGLLQDCKMLIEEA
jgi:hypothetical protein